VAQTLKAGLIGKHIGRSRFADAQALLCRETGWTLDFTPFDTALLEHYDFEQHIDSLPGQGFHGITVTHPYKTRAHSLAQSFDYPETLGASNLLRFNAGAVEAFNTDYTGFKGAWRAEFGSAAPGRVAMAGAGGVSRALIAGLLDLGAERIDLWDITAKLAQTVADSADPDAKRVTALADNDQIADAIQRADGLLNATPMGMDQYPGMAFDPDLIGAQGWAFDAVYAPITTAFMTAAEKAGLRTMNGFDLFRHMAVSSFEVYTGCLIDKPTAVDRLRPLAEGL